MLHNKLLQHIYNKSYINQDHRKILSLQQIHNVLTYQNVVQLVAQFVVKQVHNKSTHWSLGWEKQ